MQLCNSTGKFYSVLQIILSFYLDAACIILRHHDSFSPLFAYSIPDSFPVEVVEIDKE